jgi:inner membrane transporter RhtA
MRFKTQISQHPVPSSILAIFFATLSIQYGATLAKALFTTLGPAQTALIRLSLASLFLSAIWKPWKLRLKPSDLKLILAYGASLGCMNFCFYLSLQRIPLGIAVALEFTGPLALSLLSSKKALDFLWAFLAILGLILITPIQHTSSDGLDPTGMSYALLAGLCWVSYIIFGQRAVKKVPGHCVATLGMITATLAVLPFGVFHGITPSQYNLNILGLGLLVALLSSALPYSLEMIALKHLPTQTFGILMSLEPAIAALIGLLFLREQLSLPQVLSILMIVTASLGSALSASRHRKKRTPALQEIPL